VKIRSAIVAVVAAASLPVLAGCGFTPLYAQPGVTASLAAIEIITPQGRTGHLLAEDLTDELGLNRSEVARYKLNLAVDEIRHARGLQVEDVASWYELSVKVSYSLVDIASSKTVTAGVVPVSVSYNAVRDPYAGIVAQQDGQKRAAREAAMRVRLELSRYFASQGGPTPPPAAPGS
jgi:LPS-assembly lipoprotein